jgi:hypothetical protein
MTTVWLVRAESKAGPFEIWECEATPIYESGEWSVNVRGSSCRSKLFEVVPDEKVYKTREAAEKRVAELERGEA